jgi:hypothetical protein
MGRLARNKEDARKTKRERDRLYRQRKRQQLRLEYHPDSLAQLADVETQRGYLAEENDAIIEVIDVETQQEYLAEENDTIVEAMVFEAAEDKVDAIDISGIIEESGEVLENFPANNWDEGFNNDFEGDFDDRYRWNIYENGIESLEITNNRGKC